MVTKPGCCSSQSLSRILRKSRLPLQEPSDELNLCFIALLNSVVNILIMVVPLARHRLSDFISCVSVFPVWLWYSASHRCTVDRVPAALFCSSAPSCCYLCKFACTGAQPRLPFSTCPSTNITLPPVVNYIKISKQLY